MDKAEPLFVQVRRPGDRRQGQRRDPRWRFDPMFAASLVSQIAPAETVSRSLYPERPKPPSGGRFVNIRT